MPVRTKYLTKEYKLSSGRTYSVTYTEEEYARIERLKSLVPKHNEEMDRLLNELIACLPPLTNVVVRPFRKIAEFKGMEFLKPRNYLAKEVVEIITADGIIRGLVSETGGNLKDLKELIVERFNKKEYTNERKTSWEREPSGNAESTEGRKDYRGVINDIRLRYRK